MCVHNSARSQMAEALLKRLAGDRFEVMSAGLEPGRLNPLAVAAMQDMGIDISAQKTKSVFDLFQAGQKFDHVITVCDESAGRQCPYVPGVTRRLHWSLPDPAALEGNFGEKLARTMEIRGEIEQRVEDFAAKAWGA